MDRLELIRTKKYNIIVLGNVCCIMSILYHLLILNFIVVFSNIFCHAVYVISNVKTLLTLPIDTLTSKRNKCLINYYKNVLHRQKIFNFTVYCWITIAIIFFHVSKYLFTVHEWTIRRAIVCKNVSMGYIVCARSKRSLICKSDCLIHGFCAFM